VNPFVSRASPSPGLASTVSSGVLTPNVANRVRPSRDSTGLAPPASAQQTPVKFTLDFVIQGPQAPFFLAAERGHSHAELADAIHKSRPYVSNTLALTRLPADVKKEYFAEGATVSREIMISIARQETPEAMRALWRRVKLESMSVKRFRSREVQGRSAPEPSTDLLRLVRRVNRLVSQVDPATIPATALPPLRRALRKAEGRISALLSRL